MRYPAWLHCPNDADAVVEFLDLPGALAAGETAEAALAAAEEVLALHLAGMAEDGVAAPPPSRLVNLKGAAASADTGTQLLVLVTAKPPKAPAVRVNITVDKVLLAEIDAAAAATGTTRSGFLAEAARRLMAGD